MGLFFEQTTAKEREPQLRAAFRRLLTSEPPTSEADADQLVSRTLAATYADRKATPRIQLLFHRAAGQQPSRIDADIEAEVTRYVREAADSDEGGLKPRWAVFIGAAILLVIVLTFTYLTASGADAQPKDVTSSQLKTLSTTLIGSFTTLFGIVVGLIGGEAVAKKG